MRNLNKTKLASLPTADTLLDSKYGTNDSHRRQSFDAKSLKWYDSQVATSSYRITMPIELHEYLTMRAKQTGQSVSKYVSHILAKEVPLVKQP